MATGKLPPARERLLAMMREWGVSQSKLAKEMDLTPTSIGRYLDKLSDGTLDDEIWAQMVEALHKLGIKTAEQIRPVTPPVMSPVTGRHITGELLPLLARWTEPDDIATVIKLLEAPDIEREMIIVFAREILRRMQQI